MLLYRRRIGTCSDRILIALFLAALAVPLAGFLLGRGVHLRTERRELAGLPSLSSRGRIWKDFPRAFEAYFNDHFGYRAVLIGWSNVLKGRFNVSSSPSVILGTDSWLYYRTKPLAEVPGPFTDDELQTWQRVLEHRQEWLARRGCRYVLIIPPNKETIYPEHLPGAALPYVSVHRLDQLVDHLRRHSTVPVVDVRSALREASRHELTYFKHDAHWNDRGAFVAYQHLARQLSQWFSAIEPLPRSAFRDVSRDRPGGDLAEMLGQDYRVEDALDLEPIVPRRARLCGNVKWPKKAEFPLGKPFAAETDDSRLPRAVMFHDSFTVALHPFLSEHFRRIAYYWHDDFHQDVIDPEHPDVVIHELLERKLWYVQPNDIEE